MDKYSSGYYNYTDGESKIRGMLTDDENLLWTGKPKKSAFILNKCIVMAPIAMIWLLFDGFFIGAMLSVPGGLGMGNMGFFFVIFFAFHLMPVWIWLYNMLTAAARWKNTEYAITDKRILIRSGFVGYEYLNIYYKEIGDVHLHVGVIDRMLGVGDIMVCNSTMPYGNGRTINTGSNNSILDIPDYQEVFNMLQKAVRDIQSDIEYPNAYRPEYNSGYKTNYKG